MAHPASPLPSPDSRLLPSRLTRPSPFSACLLRLFTLGLLVAGMVATPARSVAAQQQAVLVGTVSDRMGQPIADASVRAEGPVVRSAVSDSRGAFRIPGLPEGRYMVSVEGLGYGGASVEAEVVAGMAPVALQVDVSPLALEPLRVVATVRGGRPAISLPVKVDLLDTEMVRTQQSLATNPTEMLSNLIPSFSPGRQKLTSAGESFRGRRPLFLIDGVPQSNPLRDGRRDGFTIGADAIDRIEVVFGANAIQGLGATGGIVNYLTVSAPEDGEFEQRISLSTNVDGGVEGEGAGFRGHYLAAKDFGDFDLLGSFGWESRGLQYDGEGRPIAIDNVQGDIANSESRSLFLKLGWEPSSMQRLQLSVSDFLLEQQGEFVGVDGDRDSGIPATSVEGSPAGTQPVNDVTTLSLDWEHRDLLGGTTSLKLYRQDFAALFGGGTFGVFQDPAIAPVGTLFDQSENNSVKNGLRATWAGQPLAEVPLDVVAGVDLLQDRTFQRLAQTDRNWVPETTFRNSAPFLQSDLDLARWLTISGGMRWEFAELDVPTFTPLAGNRPDFQTSPVAGGSPSFDEPLFNLGAVVTPARGLRLYGSAAQAFSMPDVGRVLRGVSEPDTEVDDFLDLQPIETDNLEFGATHSTERTRFGFAWFQSESDFGSRLVANPDGIFQVTREPTRTRGMEFTGRVDPLDGLSLQAGYSMLEGEFDSDDDGSFESDLGAADVGPNRLNLSANLEWGERFSGRLQTFSYFDRTFEDGAGNPTASFDGYTTVDAAVTARIGLPSVTLAISNLFDEQYITYFGQAGTDRNDRYFAGRGRAVTLRVDARF